MRALRQAPRARKSRSVRKPSGNPHRAEVYGRIARLPPPKEALDRRMQHDRPELLRSEESVAANRLVLGDELGERAIEIPGEDDVNDVFRPQAPLRRYRVDDRDRPFDRQLVAGPEHPCLLDELAVERLREAFAAADSPARQEPVILPALLVPAEQDHPAPPQDGRHADAGLRSHQCADDPKPRTPRSALSGSSSTSTSSTAGTGMTTSCAILIPGSTVNALSRSVLSRTTRSSPR